MSDAREPTNAAAEAHRLIAGLRATNQGLRSTPYTPDPRAGPPLEPAEIVAQFAADTGIIVNEGGEMVGRVEGWVPPGTPGRLPDGTLGKPGQVVPWNGPVPGPQRKEEEPMFGRSRGPFVPGSRVTLSQIKGIDLVNGEVVVDGYRYPMKPEEVMEVAKFCVNAMVRDLQEQIEALKQDHGIGTPHETPEVPNDEVPAVPVGPVEGPVPGGPVPPEQPPAMVPAVPEGAPHGVAVRGGGPAKVPS